MTDVADPPPLFFAGSQRQHSTSFHNAENLSQHISSPRLVQTAPDNEDVDMSMSITLGPLGQNHDRDVNPAAMDTDEPTYTEITEAVIDSAGQTASPSPSSSMPSHDDIGDAMDTSPDQGILEPMGFDMTRADGTAALEVPPTVTDYTDARPAAVSTPANGTQGPPDSEAAPPRPDPTEARDSVHRSRSHSPINLENPNESEHQQADSGSEDEEDDDEPPWHEMKEDTSVPDEEEMREIEANEERSALDHDHWRAMAFTDLNDPEYSVGEDGIIQWSLKYNGTKEEPNRELVMNSPIVTIGGYQWRIKFYPRGMSHDYLSIYLECVSMKEGPEGPEAQDNASKHDYDANPTKQAVVSESDEEAPLQALPGCAAPRRRHVSAQAAIVLYNPAEPRVNVFKSFQHLYCPKQVDWGFERYHGPFYEIHHRVRCQRQALLRNDTLALTAYLRIVNDNTGCLWEHTSGTNPWDSQAMVGLPSLAMSLRPRPTGDGSLVAAVSLWLLIPSLRAFLYALKVDESHKHDRPMLVAILSVLYMMRTPSRNQTGSTHVSLFQITRALQWYGVKAQLDNMDVIELWHMLRSIIEHELQASGNTGSFTEIFGAAKDALGRSIYKIPSTSKSVKEGLHSIVIDDLHGSCPHVLQVEIERQVFDESSRCWNKSSAKVALDEHIELGTTPYTLFGFATHKGGIRSDRYQSVLRPRGSLGKWYCFKDSRDGNKVICLTRRQALEQKSSSDDDNFDQDSFGTPYIVLYVRSDQLGQSEPLWQVPTWLAEECDGRRAASSSSSPAGSLRLEALLPQSTQMQEIKQQELSATVDEHTEHHESLVDSPHRLIVLASHTFDRHVGPGILNTPILNGNVATIPEANQEGKVVEVTKLEPELIRSAVAEAFKVEATRCRIFGLEPGTAMQPAFSSLQERILQPDHLTEHNLLWLHIIPEDGQTTSTKPSSSSGAEAEVYVFLKTFDVERQRLVAKGSHIVAKSARIDKTVAKILNLSTSSDSFPDIVREKDAMTSVQLVKRRTFAQECVPDVCVLITNPTLTDEKKLDFRSKGLATSVGEHLEMESWKRNFPASYRGVFERDYFSSPYYKGEMLAGRPHGKGVEIALNGMKYSGEFALSERHGQGLLEYTNGDTYQGGFVSNLRHGHGVFTEADTGNVYEGGWKNDKRFGEGVARYKKSQGMIRMPECKICYEEDADCFFVDCGHVVACLACAKRMESCPVCRRKILRVNQLQFTVGC